MNRLDAPTFFDDRAALDDLSNNVRAASYPRLKRHIRVLKAGYEQYLAVNGNVRAVLPVQIPKITGKFLNRHYSSPNSDLWYIDEIRDRSGVNTCPMCGSLHSGTLDHVMPKALHPAFALLGLNLVPACKCNNERSSAISGPKAGERVLHPYFDDVLKERILAAHFDDLGAIPRTSVRMVLALNHPDHAAVQFHFDNVVQKTGILTYLEKCWSKLIVRPWVIAVALRHNPTSREELVNIIEEERERNDDYRDSKNNWDSIFLSGLLDADVIDWIFATMSRPGRSANCPLL
jgi:hypothetical protein